MVQQCQGIGFLEYDGGADVFVHYIAIQTGGFKKLSEGDEVEFNVVSGKPQADQVTILKKSSSS